MAYTGRISHYFITSVLLCLFFLRRTIILVLGWDVLQFQVYLTRINLHKSVQMEKPWQLQCRNIYSTMQPVYFIESAF